MFSSSRPPKPCPATCRKNSRRAASTPAPDSGPPLLATEESRRWQELLPHLPENARLLWHALEDMSLLWRVLRACGGQSLRIPRRMPGEDSPLCRAGQAVPCQTAALVWRHHHLCAALRGPDPQAAPA